MPKKKVEDPAVKIKIEDLPEPVKIVESEKEKLLKLYQQLMDLNIRSISDLENLIARV